MIAFEDRIANDTMVGTWGFSFDSLVELRGSRVCVTPEIVSKLVADLETRLDRLAKVVDPAVLEPHAACAAALRLARYYRRMQRLDEARRVIGEAAEVFRRKAESVMPLVGAGWLQDMLRIVTEFGMSDEADAIRETIVRLGRSGIEQMPTVTHSIQIDGQEFHDWLSALAKGDLRSALSRVAAHFTLDKQTLVDQCNAINAAYPLAAMLPVTKFHRSGRPIASIGRTEIDVEGRLIYDAAERLGYSAAFLRAAMARIGVDHKPSPSEVVAVLCESPVFERDNLQLVETGIHLYLAGDHAAAAHVLMPQIEAAIRRFAWLARASIHKQGRNGAILVKNLDDLLREPSVVASLGESVVLYLRTLLTDPRGWNARNDLCHGLLPGDWHWSAVADRIFHVLILFGQLRRVEEGG
jgi:hypothetical protein